MRPFLLTLLLLTLPLLACKQSPQPVAPAEQKQHLAAPEGSSEGLVFRVSPGREQAPELPTPKLSRLSAEQATRLLDRAGPLPSPSPTAALPKQSKPRPEAQQHDAFPAPKAPPPVPEGPLEVERVTPDEQELRGLPTVTFSQPMVKLGEQRDAPVELEPQVAGRWRWLGTNTVVFEPHEKMPRSTAFQVTIPAKTRAAGGAELAEEVRAKFSTPTVELTNALQTNSATPLIYLEFNQEVDPAAVLAKASLDEIPLKLAASERWQKDQNLKTLAESSEPEAFVVLTTTEPLPPGEAPLTLEIAAGLTSKEGPLQTDKSLTFEVWPLAPLKVRHAAAPTLEEAGYVAFTNPLDPEAWQDSWLKVEPEVPQLHVEHFPFGVALAGDFAPGQRYTATFAGDTVDIYGQKLGNPATATLESQGFFWIPTQCYAVVSPEHPALPVRSTGAEELELTVWAVEPAHLEPFFDGVDMGFHYGKREKIPGKKLFTRPLSRDGLKEIDLSEAYREGGSSLVVMVHTREKPLQTVWVEVSNLGLHTSGDATQLYLWATDNRTSEPLEGVKLRLLGEAETATTGADGLATLKRPTRPVQALVASAGEDRLVMPPDIDWGSRWEPAQTERPDILWAVLDDRGLYRPKEKVHFKGWLRQRETNKPLDWGPKSAIGYKITTGRSKKPLTSGQLQPNRFGGFELSYTLPQDAPTGSYCLVLDLGADVHRHWFDVAEFRRPKFELSLNVSEGPHLLGQKSWMEVSARYFDGGALGNGATAWSFTPEPGHFTPSGWDEFRFGPRRAEWWQRNEQAWREQKSQGRTDSHGSQRVELEFLSVWPPGPVRLQAQTRVVDRDQQSWSVEESLLLHPAAEYVGLKTSGLFAEGKPLEFQSVVTDIEGTIKAERPLIFTLSLDDEVLETTTASSTTEPQTLTLKEQKRGRYLLSAYVQDDEGRWNCSQQWVQVGPSRTRGFVEEQGGTARQGNQRAQLALDKSEYSPNETATLTVNSPFPKSRGLLTVSHENVLERRLFEVNDSVVKLELPVTEAMLPNLNLRVDLLENGGPGSASAEENLRVSVAARALKVDVKPASTNLRPGQTTEVSITVKDQKDQPVRDAEVCFWMVDEAIFALQPYELLEPMKIFYKNRHSQVYFVGTREALVRPKSSPMRNPALSGEVQSAKQGRPAIEIRSDFNPLATFAGTLLTDAQGQAKTSFKIPDNLTRYRLMAVACYGVGSFGQAQSQALCRLPLAVKPSPPRFLSLDDNCHLPVLVSNQSDREASIEVALRAVGLQVKDPGFEVSVPAQSRVEVPFEVVAKELGQARVQTAVASSEAADAVEFSFPVQMAGSSETRATYGVLDEGVLALPVKLPEQVSSELGSVELTTSNSLVSNLDGAAQYLSDYPFGCAEQTASRLLGLWSAPPVSPALTSHRKQQQRQLLKQLLKLQDSSGGWPFWEGQPPDPFVSAHAALALFRVRESLEVDRSAVIRARDYLRNLADRIDSDYSENAALNARAYALAALNLLNEKDPEEASAILVARSLEDHPACRLAWLLQGMGPDWNETAGLRRHLLGRLQEDAAEAHLVSHSRGRARAAVFYSSTGDDAVALQALAQSGDHPLLPKLAQGLLSVRENGHWSNTVQNAWALAALGSYLQQQEPADFQAEAWLGEHYLGQQKFEEPAVRNHLELPLATLGKQPDLTLSKQGPGKLYYRLGLNYFLAGRNLEPLDAGLAVEREYTAVDSPEDVRRDEEGVWHVKAGARVKITLRLMSSQKRQHLALVDQLPGGFEPVNTNLKGSTMPGYREYSYWSDHQDLRDEGCQLFASSLWPGLHQHTYYAQATTRGDFTAPPARAELMYSPEVFGRSASDRVVVE